MIARQTNREEKKRMAKKLSGVEGIGKGTRIGLKYCGGCNPRYDRVLAVGYLRERLQGTVELVSYEDPDIAGVLVVAGCPTACVDLQPFKERPVWVVTNRQQIEDFLEHMRTGTGW